MSIRMHPLQPVTPPAPAAGFVADRPDLGHAAEGWDLSDASFVAGAIDPTAPRHLPQAAYRSLAFADLEDDAVWTRSWLCIGTQYEIPDTGDLLPFTAGHHGIHVQREADGRLVGRFNKAQHGGCRAVPLQCQTGTKTRCSFTACGYSRDGRALPAAPEGGATPAMHQYLGMRPERLLPVSVRTTGPLIFVNLDAGATAEPMTPLAFPGSVPKTLDGASGHRREYSANWKLLLAALAAGGDALPSSDSLWLTTTLSDGVQAEIRVLFPNLILLSACGETCAILLQPVALGETLCRIALFGGPERGRIQWLAEIEKRAAVACAMQEVLSHSRDDDPEAALPAPSAAARWLNRKLAAAIQSRPDLQTTEPLYTTALGRRR